MTSLAQQIADHHDAAQQAMRRGLLREVHQHCLAILKLDQSFADAWFLCGVIATQNGQLTRALDILGNAVRLQPDNPEYRAELGKLLVAVSEPEQALREAEAALSLQPSATPTLNTLGAVFSHTGVHEKALACFEHAAENLEKHEGAQTLSADWRADLYFNLAASLQFAGRFVEAESAYERAIALQPTLFKAHTALANVRRQKPLDNHLERLESLRNRISSPRDQLHLGHAIAKEQEDLGRYQDAFASLAWAKRAQSALAAYRPSNDARLFAGIRELFTRELFQGAPIGCETREPIFIVGMPRTGTTLVEQILSGHSQVYAAGELQNFPLQVKRAAGAEPGRALDLEMLTDALQFDPRKLGRSYIDSTRPRTGHTPRFIDKLPINFLCLGLIRLALPNAKLVCLRRDPMDTCLSNYRQLFAVKFQHYHYNYDLLDCGRYYIQFDQLMHHWRELMPGAILELQYESLVENPEQVVRELLAFCELPWEGQCLDFHRRKTSVATPSAAQVRQGIYTSAVDRWRRYGDAMQPLYEVLQSAGFYP